MTRIVAMFLCAIVSGCLSFAQKTQVSDEYLAKQEIAFSNLPDGAGAFCLRQPGGPQPSLNDIYDIKIQKDDSYDLAEEKIKEYGQAISFSKKIEVHHISCWDGSRYMVADVGELRNLTQTWFRIIWGTYNGSTHKCAYAEDPNTWTTESCPSKFEGSVG